MSMRTPLSRVRGLGSAKSGTAHWWSQRVTAIANIPLVIWLAASIVALSGQDHATVVIWVQQPPVAVLLILTIANLFRHAALGVQVVIEDYIHNEGTKLGLLLFVNALAIFLGALGAYCVLITAFGN